MNPHGSSLVSSLHNTLPELKGLYRCFLAYSNQCCVLAGQGWSAARFLGNEVLACSVFIL